MAGKFEIYKDKAGEFRFRLKTIDGKIVLVSEGYTAKSGCTNGVESVKKNAPEDARYECKQTQSGKFMFNLKATNGQVIGTSESHESAADRDTAIKWVQNGAPDADVMDTTT